jgi:hypothetical protein
MMKMKFPRVLYVKMDKDGDMSYPIPATQLIDLAEMGRMVQIGVYELRETSCVECEVKTSGTVKK